MRMAPEKVDNSFTRLVGIKHPWEFVRKILEYEIQGVHYTWTPKDVLMNLKEMFKNFVLWESKKEAIENLNDK
jgi:hypothetical protein